MKAEKKLIERELKFSQKFIYKGITRGSIESGECTSCDNCGKLITNMVQIYDDATCKYYMIGTDCAETLSKAGCLFNKGRESDFNLDIYCFNLTLRFVTELRKGCELVIGEMYCKLINTKGKEISVYTPDLEKFFPEYLSI